MVKSGSLEELEASITNILNRYNTALYSFQLYTHLHQTLDVNIYKNEGAERNCTLKNEFSWILGESVENIFLNYAILTSYSLFEHKLLKDTDKIKGGDTDSIYLLIQGIEDNKNLLNLKITAKGDEIEKNFGEKPELIDNKFLAELKSTLKSDEEFINKNLRNFRHQIGHNFVDLNKVTVTVDIEILKELISRLGNIINLITSRIWFSMTLYEVIGDEIYDDYRRLFIFLDRQKQVSNLFTLGNKSDENIMQELNKIYRPYLN